MTTKAAVITVIVGTILAGPFGFIGAVLGIIAYNGLKK